MFVYSVYLESLKNILDQWANNSRILDISFIMKQYTNKINYLIFKA